MINMLKDSSSWFDIKLGNQFSLMFQEFGLTKLIIMLVNVRIDPLKVWHDVINFCILIFINKFIIHFYLSSFYVLYLISILPCISCIICDLGALGVARKIQIMIPCK